MFIESAEFYGGPSPNDPGEQGPIIHPSSARSSFESNSLPPGYREIALSRGSIQSGNVFSAAREAEENLPPPANSAVSIRSYSPRVAELLASFFEGDLSRSKCAELSGLLVFPHSRPAAELYLRAMQRGPSERQKLLLRGFALYPDDEQAAGLFAKKQLQPESLSGQEILKLIVAQAFPGDTRKQQQELAYFDSLNIAKLDQQQRAHELSIFVRAELLNPRGLVTSEAELAKIFLLEPSLVQTILNETLNEEEAKIRGIRLSNKHNDETFALKNLLTTAIRSLVRIENELHESGILSNLSSSKKLADLFGISDKEIEGHLRFIPSRERAYRARMLSTPEQVLDHEQLYRQVKSELDKLMNGTGDRLSSDSELAEQFGVLPVSIFHSLSKSLTNNDKKYRDFMLKHHGSLSSILTSSSQFVREELEAFRRGEIDRIYSIPELAEVFDVSPDLLIKTLLESSGALSPADVRYRRLILNLQGPKDPSSEALRQVVYSQLKDRIEKHRLEKRLVSKATGPVLDRHGRPARISFRGIAFDSFEEAATALLLEKYIPGFDLQPGQNLQFAVGKHFLDFVLTRAIVEYHPILLFRNREGLGSFRTHDEYKRFNEIKASLNKVQKRLFIEETRESLAQEYRRERLEIISQSPTLRDRELIVTTSPEEVYYLVIKRFGERVPSYEKFKREFNRMKLRVKQSNS